MARILLVEDDEISSEMLTLRLQLRGYEVLHSDDGQLAITTATEELPDLILLDMNLPSIDGWTVARALKQSVSPTAHIPIIGVSAHAMSGDRENALAAGCDDYETKPVDWVQLLPKIEALLQKGQPS